MDRKKLLIPVLCIMMPCMTACGNRIPEMTEQESAVVSEYAANLLLKYSNAYSTRLVDTSKAPEEGKVAQPAEIIVSEKTEDGDPQEENENETTQGSEAAGTVQETEKAQMSIAQVLGLESFDVVYTGYHLCDNYPDDSMASEDLFFVMSAGEGAKLLILDLDVTNIGAGLAECSTIEIPAKYRVTLNGEHTQNALVTMLEDDFSAMNIRLQAGETAHAVIVAEISQERADALQSVGLEIRLDSNSTVITK